MFSKKSDKPKKKNRRILFQTGVFIVLLLFLAGIVLTLLLYLNAVTSFSIIIGENQAAFAKYVSDEMRDFDAISWLINYWADHPGSLTEEEINNAHIHLSALLDELGRPDSHDITDEDAGKLSLEEQKYFADFSYAEIAAVFEQVVEELPVDQIVCYVPDEDDVSYGTIIFHGAIDGMSNDLEIHKVTVDIESTDEDFLIRSITFVNDEGEETYGLEGAYLNLIGQWDTDFIARPIGIGAAINSNLVEKMNKNSGTYITMLIAIMIIVTALLLLFLNIVVSRPLRKVKAAITRYQDNKDADQVVTDLSKMHSRNEIGVLADNFSSLAQEMDRYTKEMEQVAADREHAATELNVATSIQSDMLPSIFPPFPDRTEFDIYATMEPAKGVAGDFYDFYFLDNDHLVLTMADVSGKSIPAALFMAISKTTLKNRAITGGGTPAEILEDTNNQLCEGNKSNFFVTVWLGILTVSTGDLFVANAGHEYPAMRLQDNDFELVRTKHGPMLGAMEGVVYHNEHYKLSSGDALLLYTDGVTEATAADQTMFTEKRLEDVLKTVPRDANAKEILHIVRAAVGDFVGDAPQFDDLTMLSFIYYKKEDSPLLHDSDCQKT